MRALFILVLTLASVAWPNEPSANHPTGSSLECIDGASKLNPTDGAPPLNPDEGKWTAISETARTRWSDSAQRPMLTERLNWGLSILAERDAEAFRLFHGVDGKKKSLRQIGAQLGVSAPTVRRYIDNAEKALSALDRKVGLFDGSKDLTTLMRGEGPNLPLRILKLEEKMQRALFEKGIVTVGQLAQLTEEELGAIPNVAGERVRQIREALESQGYSLAPTQLSLSQLADLTPQEVWGEDLSPTLLPVSIQTRNLLIRNAKTFPSVVSLKKGLRILERTSGFGPKTISEIKDVLIRLEQVVPVPEDLTAPPGADAN